MRELLVAVLVPVLTAVPNAYGQQAATVKSVRIAERSVLPGAIRKAAQSAAERDFNEAQVIAASPELDLTFETGKPPTTCRVETRTLKNVIYQGVFPTDIVVRADSVLGASPSSKQSEICANAAQEYFVSVREQLAELVGQDLVIFVNGPPSVAHDVSEWIKRQGLWQVTDELGKENATLEIERKGSKFNVMLFCMGCDPPDLLGELGTELLPGLRHIQEAVIRARKTAASKADPREETVAQELLRPGIPLHKSDPPGLVLCGLGLPFICRYVRFFYPPHEP